MPFRDFISTVATVLPEVAKPTKPPSFREKLLWTLLALTIYLVMGEVPLFGVAPSQNDYLTYTRVIFASQQGSLLELGIGPIVTAGLITQLLAGSELMRLDFTKPEDRALFTAFTKFLTILVAIAQALAYTLGGLFGPVGQISPTAAVIIVLQLVSATVIVMLLDEVVQKGWGIGSGISLFIMGGVAQRVFWDLFSPAPWNSGGRVEFYGLVPFLVGDAPRAGLVYAVFRDYVAPSIFALVVTAAVVLLIIYLEAARLEIPLASTQYRGFRATFPLKLDYVSVVPVILSAALITNITFFSQFLYFRYNPGGTNPIINALVRFDPNNVQKGPIGGLVYYITSPRTLLDAMSDPLRAVTSTGFLVVFCVLFGRLWIELSGMSADKVAENLIRSNVQVPGFRRAKEPVSALLNNFIPVVTVLSSIIVGLLAGIGNLLGVLGSGTGLLLLVSILLQYYQLLLKERIREEAPAVARMIGLE
jgi:preprotein translocase SecY subunit